LSALRASAVSSSGQALSPLMNPFKVFLKSAGASSREPFNEALEDVRVKSRQRRRKANAEEGPIFLLNKTAVRLGSAS